MDKCSFDYQNISIGSFTSSLCVTVGYSRILVKVSKTALIYVIDEVCMGGRCE